MLILIIFNKFQPPPTVTWTLNKATAPVANDEHYAIGNIDYQTTFNLVNAARKHSGIYTITATNVNGTDSAEVEITILGKPSKPKGPLKVSDVHKEGCTLKWDKVSQLAATRILIPH